MKTIFNTIITTLVASFALFPGIAFADWDNYDGWHMGSHMMGWSGMGYGWGWLMIFLWLAVFVILVFLIRWMLSITQKESDCTVVQKTALDILKERFARGEINEDEFKKKQSVILGNQKEAIL